jgi:hypothetical protein
LLVLPEICDITNLGLLLRSLRLKRFPSSLPLIICRSAACLGVQGVLYGKGPEVFDQRSLISSPFLRCLGQHHHRARQVCASVNGLLLGHPRVSQQQHQIYRQQQQQQQR